MISWNEWFISLKVAHWVKFGIQYDAVGYSDDAFYEMYQDGLTPPEAIKEEYDAMCSLL